MCSIITVICALGFFFFLNFFLYVVFITHSSFFFFVAHFRYFFVLIVTEIWIWNFLTLVSTIVFCIITSDFIHRTEIEIDRNSLPQVTYVLNNVMSNAAKRRQLLIS